MAEHIISVIVEVKFKYKKTKQLSLRHVWHSQPKITWFGMTVKLVGTYTLLINRYIWYQIIISLKICDTHSYTVKIKSKFSQKTGRSIDIFENSNKRNKNRNTIKHNNVIMTAVDLKALPWQHIDPSSFTLGRSISMIACRVDSLPIVLAILHIFCSTLVSNSPLCCGKVYESVFCTPMRTSLVLRNAEWICPSCWHLWEQFLWVFCYPA